MTFSLLAGLSVAGTLEGQTPSPVPAALETRVTQTIAQIWQVPPTTIQLEWGHIPSAHPLEADATYRLMGQGNEGGFILAFDRAGGQAAAVKIRAGVLESVLVAARPLPAGTKISLADVTLSTRLTWGPPRNKAELLPGAGWIVRHPLAMGAAIVPPAVVPPPLIEAGAPIKLQWEAGAVSVAVSGVAVNAAALGQVVQVRTTGRPGLVRGVVTGPGVARMERQ